ncbi:MAG: hypothetical protein AAF636_17670 [Pseudomonadota bacterium]
MAVVPLFSGCKSTTSGQSGGGSELNTADLSFSFVGFESSFICLPLELPASGKITAGEKSSNPELQIEGYFTEANRGWILCSAKDEDADGNFGTTVHRTLPPGTQMASITVSKDCSAPIDATLDDGTMVRRIRENVVDVRS